MRENTELLKQFLSKGDKPNTKTMLQVVMLSREVNMYPQIYKDLKNEPLLKNIHTSF